MLLFKQQVSVPREFMLVCASVIAAGVYQIFFVKKKREPEIGFFHLQTRLTSWKISVYSRCHVIWQGGRLQLNSITASHTGRRNTKAASE